MSVLPQSPMIIHRMRIKKEQVQPDLLGSYLLYRCIDHHYILHAPGYDLPALPLLCPAFCHPFKQCFLADLDPVPTPECREAFLMYKLVCCCPGYPQNFLHFLHIQNKGKIVIICRSVIFHRHGPPFLKISCSFLRSASGLARIGISPSHGHPLCRVKYHYHKAVSSHFGFTIPTSATIFIAPHLCPENRRLDSSH